METFLPPLASYLSDSFGRQDVQTPDIGRKNRNGPGERKKQENKIYHLPESRI
jgi:hypothetical protein